MNNCKSCFSVLAITFSQDGRIIYVCTCGKRYVANNATETLLFTKNYSNAEDTSKYAPLIENAALDGANALVSMACDKCGLDYMAQVVVGDTGNVIYACKCGNYSTI